MRVLVPITILLVILGVALGWYQKERIAAAKKQTALLSRYRGIAESSSQSISNTLERLTRKHAITKTNLNKINEIKNDVISNIPPEITSEAKPKVRKFRKESNATANRLLQFASSMKKPSPAPKPIKKKPSPKPKRVSKPRRDEDAPEGMMTREQLESKRSGKSKKPSPKPKPEPEPSAQEIVHEQRVIASMKELKGAELEKARKKLFATIIQEQAMDASDTEHITRTAMLAVQAMLAQAVRKKEKALLTTLPSRAREQARDLIGIRKEAEAKEALVDGMIPRLAGSMELAVSVQRDLHEILTRHKEKKDQLQKEEDRRNLIANNLAGVRKIKSANIALLKIYKFNKAITALRKQLAVTSVEQAQAEINILIDRCARLQLLKKFIIKRLTELQFRFGWQQTGSRRDILGATDNWIKVKGEDFLWGAVDFTQMTSIIEHCIADVPLSRTETGRLRLAIAVWCQEHDRILEGEKHGDTALELQPELRAEHKHLFDQYRKITRKE
ncbi:MAG: hypothetical protein KAH23_02545 [Kiritimatiellae bacterium]|nr:hypothetical protein [Kiritimatiellia bacterium]